MDNGLAKAIYLWAKDNTTNQQLLEEWQTAALTEIANGNGKSVASTTTNGVSVSFQTGGISIMEWFQALTTAISYINSKPVSKITGIFR